MNYQWIKIAWGLPDIGEPVWGYIQQLPGRRTLGMLKAGEIIRLWLAQAKPEKGKGYFTNSGPHHLASLYPEEVSHWMPWTAEKPSKPTY